MGAASETREVLAYTDEQLVERLRGGDRSAFDGLYDRYFKRVYHFAQKRLDNRADVEETTQEIFMNVLVSIDSFRGEAPFGAWVFGVTRRTIAGRFKRKRHSFVPLIDQEPTPMLAGGPSRDPSPIEAVEFNQRLERLSRILEEELSAEQRQLFRMHHLEDQPISTIAARLHKTEDAVKSHLYRARRLLLRG